MAIFYLSKQSKIVSYLLEKPHNVLHDIIDTKDTADV